MNRTAFNALGEEVNEFLQSGADQRTKDAVLTLFNQCDQALTARAERRDAHDAFKVAARIAVLSNLIGKVPQQAQMERELKAIIQQYMERMTENRLVPSQEE